MNIGTGVTLLHRKFPLICLLNNEDAAIITINGREYIVPDDYLKDIIYQNYAKQQNHINEAAKFSLTGMKREDTIYTSILPSNYVPGKNDEEFENYYRSIVTEEFIPQLSKGVKSENIIHLEKYIRPITIDEYKNYMSCFEKLLYSFRAYTLEWFELHFEKWLIEYLYNLDTNSINALKKSLKDFLIVDVNLKIEYTLDCSVMKEEK